MTDVQVIEARVNEALLSDVRPNPPAVKNRAGSSRKAFLQRKWLLALATALLIAIAAGLVFGWRFYGGQVDSFAAAWAAVERGDLTAARKSLANLKASGQRPSQERLIRGAMLLKKGYYYPALDELEELRSDAELKASALTLIGQAWYHLGRHVEAQLALQEVVKQNPSAVEAHRWLAASYYDLGAIHDALHHLLRTAELDPLDHRPHRLLGLIYKDYERYDDAVPHYQESLRLKADQPDANDVRLELAACLVKLRRHRQALTALEPCVASAEASVLRAECRHSLGETAQAKEALAAALLMDSANLEGLLLRGTILLEEGAAKEAVDVFLRATQSHPKDYLAHFKLAQAYARADDSDLAAAEQKVADQIRDVRKEFADLHQVAWDRPNDVQVRLRLATLAQALDRPDLADVWLKSAAALQPLSTENPLNKLLDPASPKTN